VIYAATEHLPDHISIADVLGFIPDFLNEGDPRDAREQIDAAYQHGGGWRQYAHFALNPDTLALTYPGDPAMMPLVITTLRDERVVIYQSGWVMILSPDGSYTVARLD
jgi:hypothetical protein